MSTGLLRIRGHLRHYKRDTYLGTNPVIAGKLPVLDCAVGFAQWGLSPLAKIAHEQFDPQLVVPYPELFHATRLKPAILERFEIPGLSPDQIFLGHGSFNLAERVIHKLIEPTNMLGVGPQFNEIPSEFVAAGGHYHPIPIEAPEFLFPTTKLVEALVSGKFDVLYLNNPNNPLGREIPLSTLGSLLETAQRRGTIVMVDEAYGDALPDSSSAVHLIHQFENLMVLRSCSKVLGLAALRVGYMFVSKGELADRYGQLDVPFEPTVHAAVLGAATLRDRTFLEEVRSHIRTAKAMIVRAFEETGYTILPTHPDVPIFTIHRSNANVVSDLAKIDVTVEPGSAFIQTHAGMNDSFCRIRVVAPDLVDEFVRRIRLLPSVREEQ